MDTMHELIDIMRAARALAGMSQSELAAAAGMSRQMVVRIENHKGNVSVDSLEIVRIVLEMEGVIFIPSTPTQGPGIALKRKAD